jgi:hypothetical protein
VKASTSTETALLDNNASHWRYMVIGEAYETWKVAMMARRNQAKLHVKIRSLVEQINNQKLPPWVYGITCMPDYLQPLPRDIVTLIRDQASHIADFCLASLKTRCAAEKHKADPLTATCRFYQHANDPDFIMAENRLLAMATQARNRENDSQRKQRVDNNSLLPTTHEQWANTLPRRRATRGPNTGNPPSRDGSRETPPRRRQQSAPPPPPHPRGDPLADANIHPHPLVVTTMARARAEEKQRRQKQGWQEKIKPPQPQTLNQPRRILRG